MPLWKKPVEKTELEKARTDALLKLDDLDPTTDEYKKIMKHVNTLSNLIAQEAPEKLSKNTILIVLGNLAAVGVIVGYESRNVLTTKAPNFLIKPKSQG